jgi:hypothetical protein
MYVLHFHEFIDVLMDGFHNLVVMNNATINMGMQVSLW